MIYRPCQRQPGAFIGRVVILSKYRYTGATTTLYQYQAPKPSEKYGAWNVDTGKRVWTHMFAKSAN